MQNNTKNNNPQKRGREAVNYTDYNIFKGNVRIVGDGKPVVMDRDDAIEMAHSRGMNLVQIAYNKDDNPRSICRIMDYSKFRYEQKKREKDEKRRQREALSDIKEIKFSIRIDDGDRNTKIGKVNAILSDGDKVKLTVRLLKREMGKMDMARDIIKSILLELDGVAEVDQEPTVNGNTISCTIRRKK